jgi:hypothetical protein
VRRQEKDKDGSAVQRVVELSRGGRAGRYGDYIFGISVVNGDFSPVYGMVFKSII